MSSSCHDLPGGEGDVFIVGEDPVHLQLRQTGHHLEKVKERREGEGKKKGRYV